MEQNLDAPSSNAVSILESESHDGNKIETKDAKESVQISTESVVDNLMEDVTELIHQDVEMTNSDTNQNANNPNVTDINAEENIISKIVETKKPEDDGSCSKENDTISDLNSNSNLNNEEVPMDNPLSKFTHVNVDHSTLDIAESENSNAALEKEISPVDNLNTMSESSSLHKEPSEDNSNNILEPKNDEVQELFDCTLAKVLSEPETGTSISETVSDKEEKTFCNNENNSEMVRCERLSVIDSSRMMIDTSDSKKGNTVVDGDSDSPEKENASEKNINKLENTEFVQISQDKHDDSQIEGQVIDAEDPFGGDNLASENIEQIETDSLTAGDENFQKLGDQADNLQDVVNAKDSSFKTNFNTSGKQPESQDSDSEKNIPIVESHSESDIVVSQSKADNINITTNMEVNNENSESSSLKTHDDTIQSSQVDNLDQESGKSKDKNEEDVEINAVNEHSDVLPGQDDELCIIPDSMKVILPKKISQKTDEVNKSNDEKVTTEDNEGKMGSGSSSETTSRDTKEIGIDDNICDTEKVMTPHTKQISPVHRAESTSDVIDIDEESKNSEIEEISTKERCKQCNEERSCKMKVKIGPECFNVCSKACKSAFKTANNKATDIPSEGAYSKLEKRCANCLLLIEPNDERNLSWETMEFCNEECLGKFQMNYGSYCRNCNGSVQAVSLGKYCVRFGYDVRQFCCSTCLEEFKKGLKVCSYCQKDISSGLEGFLAPVGDKGQFKDFCTQDCMEKYSRMSSTEPPSTEKRACSVCQEEKVVHCEVQLDRAEPVAICSDPCFAAFKFVNKVNPDQCSTCKKFFELPNRKTFVVFYENEAHTFCNKTCLNIFITMNRKIVPCNWCKVKKYNFDMIKKELKSGQVMMMCSLNCLTLYQVSINAVSARRINCDFCKEYSQAQYHLTMSDATIRNFCSYNCVMNFQGQYTKSPITIPSSDDPVPTGMPKRTVPQRAVVQSSQKNDIQNKKTLPVISSVTSLASMGNGQPSPTSQQSTVNNVGVPTSVTVQNQTQQVIYKQQIITRPPSPVKIHNKITQCKPLMHTKGVSVRPHPCTKSTQTEEIQRVVIPIPVPIYVPYPMHMYSMPYPVPLPFPLPIPVPIFIPTTRNGAKGIFKDIKRIQEKIPADPFEAELLMMAEMVATEKKANESDSDSADENSPEGVDSSNTFGDDMLQMALKMATGELDEPAVDLEAALTPNTITASQAPQQPETAIDNEVQPERLISAPRGRKRMVPYKPRSTSSKRGRRISGTNDIPLMPPPEPQPPPQPRIMEPIEKPDANMALKYTFGVNAWRQWVVTKNTELEKQGTPMRKVKLFKTDLLQLTADELNYSLCLFVKEVRKPNGAEYAPDTIYYLCLGIQQYLFENNRIDNIFTDSYYEKFTDCLNEVAKKFSVLYNDAQYIVTRVEEEHLWECKQLGAHSPHVLLSTLMFFNTKHFNLVTVEEHMQLSFSHIMKHWKRNPAAQPAAIAGKVPGSRNVLLRFYPPQSALEANSRKKKVYEQQENEENPLRCPVKLYEFYLSKCPESVKTRNDVFYLLPERSCVPDSPVWYSTSPLAKEHLIKMLYRVKMVKEINVALLTS
ncbi:zinc finger MYM-type protein 3 isoform X2 [Cephus cinctus]|uniref:Zinc finger MYM-type protein 3 isoform X2 n=1 Tax=Cephus cinctus TaxID=211228 RepID=A0AAJ7FMI7_CEPCN|nr:zinc finger MYM-type protein 3 isoform X2 [Cephus cinctus]